MDHVVIINHMNARAAFLSTRTWVADHMAAAQIGLYTIIINVYAQSLPYETRWGAVEDLVHQEPTGAHYLYNDLCKVARAPCRQRLKMLHFSLERIATMFVSACNQLVNLAAIITNRLKVTTPPQTGQSRFKTLR